MFKKFLKTAMAGVMICIMSVPAMAKEVLITSDLKEEIAVQKTSENELSERLTGVTLKVKNILELDDRFTSFYGNLNEKTVQKYWTLNWDMEDGSESLRVNATEDGKILYYYNSDDKNDYSNDRMFSPIFPKISYADAQQVAKNFLNKVLWENETVELKPLTERLSPQNINTYSFNAVLKINGIESPTNINISVRALDLKVISYSRNDRNKSYIGETPDATTYTTVPESYGKLLDKVEMKLQYVLEYEKDDKKQENPKAVLRYLPVETGDYVIDAKTGELINMADLYDDARGKSQSGDMDMMVENFAEATMASGAYKLSEVELEGIAKLDGAMPKELLDAEVRRIVEFGLTDKYDLGTVSYTLNNETGDITANIVYTHKVSEAAELGISEKAFEIMKEDGYNLFIRKYVTANGKTGEITALSTSYPYIPPKDKVEVVVTNASQKAVEFMKKYENEKLNESVQYSENTLSGVYSIPKATYVYAQNKNGYFLPSNYINVSVNLLTGYIDSYNTSWVENVEFDSADGIISNQDACKAYLDEYEITLKYLDFPVKLDPEVPEYVPYINMGYSYLYKLNLCYKAESSKYIYGVDAKTGKALSNDYTEETEIINYTDISSSYAEKQIKELALYGIGFDGTEFLPKNKVTQIDMISFLLSADGNNYYIKATNSDGLTEDQIDNMYNRAYDLGILNKQERNEQKEITREEFVKILVKISSYGKVGGIKNIFKCNFADEATISDDCYGYIAIASGMGIVNSGSDTEFAPKETVTREQAAMMLYNFMSREF